MNRTALLLALLVLAGCKSDAEKLEQLEMDRLVSCLVADASERVAATKYPGETKAEEAQRYEEAKDDRTECTLADRKLNRFLQ